MSWLFSRRIFPSLRIGPSRFRELSLTALVLQHVYPTHFAMCSHFLASQLCITGAENLPEFYRKYCMELLAWADHKWPTKSRLTVVEAEYALWTWYRLAYRGENPKERNKAKREFKNDRWIQEQRDRQVAASLNWGRRLDLAVPTLRAIRRWQPSSRGGSSRSRWALLVSRRTGKMERF
jgi:hypothetical protein